LWQLWFLELRNLFIVIVARTRGNKGAGARNESACGTKN
jgi:hypothetical protein